MIWRNPLEENPCFGRVNIVVNPFGPCCQCFLICNQTIHVFECLIPILNEIPSRKLSEERERRVLEILHVQWWRVKLGYGVLHTVVFFLCEATNAKNQISVHLLLSTFWQLQLNLVSELDHFFHQQCPPEMHCVRTST